MALTVTPTDEMKTLKVGEKIYEIVDDEARTDLTEVKADFLQSLIYDTASGSVATFPDGAHELPCKSVVAQIVPKQSGSGEPSPDNVRPISGWDVVNVTRAGKNLLDENLFARYGGVLQADGTWYLANVAPLLNVVVYKPPIGYTGQLTLVMRRKIEAGRQSLRFQVNYTDGTNERIGFAFSTGSLDIYTLTTNALKIVNNITGDYGSNIPTYMNLSIFIGSTATEYEPYTGSAYSVPLPQTVYGGEVDVVSGEGKVTYGMVDLGTLNWERNSGNQFFAPLPSPATSVTSGSINVVCTEYKTRNVYNGDTSQNGVCTTRMQAWIVDTGYTSASALKARLSGVMLAYELATPTDFAVTPQEVPTLYGSNTVYADSGDVEVEYPADTKLYIDKVIATAVSALS